MPAKLQGFSHQYSLGLVMRWSVHSLVTDHRNPDEKKVFCNYGWTSDVSNFSTYVLMNLFILVQNIRFDDPFAGEIRPFTFIPLLDNDSFSFSMTSFVSPLSFDFP